VIVRASSKLVAGENNPPTHPAEFCRTSTELCRSVCSRSCLVASPHHAFSVCAIPKGAFYVEWTGPIQRSRARGSKGAPFSPLAFKRDHVCAVSGVE